MQPTKSTPQWWFSELLPDCAPLALDAHLAGLHLCREVVQDAYRNYAFLFRGTFGKIYWDRADADRCGARVLRLIKGDAGFMPRFKREALSACEGVLSFNSEIRGLEEKSDPELASLFEQLFRRHALVMKYGFVPNMLDYASHRGYNILAEELEDYLLSLTPDRGKIAHAMSVLTTPQEESWPAKEHKAFLRLAAQILSNDKARAAIEDERAVETLASIASEESKGIDEHVKKFGWISFLFFGPVKWTRAYFLAELKAMLGENRDPLAELKDLEEKASALPAEKGRLAAELGIDGEHLRLFDAAADMMYVKAYRKDALSMAWYCLDQLARDAAGSLGVSVDQIRFASVGEIVSALNAGRLVSRLLDDRMRECVMLMEDGRQRIVSGAEAAAIAKRLEATESVKPVESTAELKGTCACPGLGTGRVRIVEKAEDMHKMRQGDVLVSHMTHPEIVVAMKKACAIVTDMGGLTCHAAIVSRELGIPCVIGTRIATKALKDGDVVEVDATEGIIRKL